MVDRINIGWDQQGRYVLTEADDDGSTGKDGAIKVAAWWRCCFGGTTTLRGVDATGQQIEYKVIRNSLTKFANNYIQTLAADGLHLDMLDEWSIFGRGAFKKDIELGILFGLERGEELLARGMQAIRIPAGQENDPGTIKQINRGLTALGYASKLGNATQNLDDMPPILYACAKLFAHYGKDDPISQKADDLMQVYQATMGAKAQNLGDDKEKLKYYYALLELTKMTKQPYHVELTMAYFSTAGSVFAAQGSLEERLIRVKNALNDCQDDVSKFVMPAGCDLQSMLALVP